MALFSKKNLKNGNYYVYSINGTFDNMYRGYLLAYNVPWNDTFFGKELKLSFDKFYDRIINDWIKLSKEAENFIIPRDISYYPMYSNKCRTYIIRNSAIYNEIVDNIPYKDNISFCGFLRESDSDSEEILYEHFIFKVS